MSDDQKSSCSGWSVPTLYTHFTALLMAQKEAVGLAQTAADRAMSKAEAAAEKRFEGVNEFRATLADQQRTLIPRAEAELRFKSQEDRISALEKQNNERGGRNEGFGVGWTVVCGAAAIAGVLFGILKH